MTAYLHAVGTAVPDHEVHQQFIDWAREQVDDPRQRKLFDRMAARSGIDRRWSAIDRTPDGGTPIEPGGFYAAEWPSTDARMQLYARAAPDLAMQAIARLADRTSLDGITHIVVASCTGFVAPGIDQIIARRLGLAPSVERLLIGFMGCYAAITALRTARHIVRSEQKARVLVVCVELTTLHLQRTDSVERLLAMLQFGDGAGAALVIGEPGGFALEAPFATTLPDSHELIRWDITDTGFAMHLSGEVPKRIGLGLGDAGFAREATGGHPIEEIDGWAVHAGGRSILDAVENALHLDPHALDASRAVLADYGNMSSATLLFVFEKLLAGPKIDTGVALAFGPGLAAEGFGFKSA